MIVNVNVNVYNVYMCVCVCVCVCGVVGVSQDKPTSLSCHPIT